MRITFDNIQSLNQSQETTSSKTEGLGSTVLDSNGIAKSLSDNNTYDGTKESAAKIKATAAQTDAEKYSDYMSVLSGCMSEEDFNEAIKNGENPATIEIKDAVTIIDRIKLEVAKSGKNVEGFTDTLDKETIEELTGLKTLATEAEASDVTLTEEICVEIKNAYEQLSEVDKITDGMKHLLLTEGEEPTIENLYLYKHSTVESDDVRGSNYFYLESTGYLAKRGAEADTTDLKTEIANLLIENDINVTDENIEASRWLIKESLPVNEENIKKFETLDAIKLPLTDSEFAHKVIIACKEGKAPAETDLTKNESIYDEAVRITGEIESLCDKPFIKETRILVETGLKMLTEANLMLLKSDYSIDTKDLEGYVEALKNLENTQSFREAKEVTETTEVIDSIKTLPAMVISSFSARINITTLEEINLGGSDLRERFKKAEISYEQVQTEVRVDLGDSIRKAFSNIPEILSNLGLEDNTENERAVRILGYNSMPITKESVNEVKEADTKLNSVLSRLTPADTLTLIRDGMSPLKMSIEELNKYLDAREDNAEANIEKYSKYLYKLEKTDGITKEERKEFIEVYRIINGIEKGDSRSVGAVVNAGWEMSLKNLKTAMKAMGYKGSDITIGDAYNVINADEATEKEWIREKYTEMKASLKAPEEIVTELVNNRVTITAENLQAAFCLRKEKGNAFKKASESNKGEAKEEELSFLESFTDEESAKEAYNTLIDATKEAVFKECMDQETYMDVKALQLVHKQLSLAHSYSKCDNFEVPMEIEGRITSVNVKLVHGEDEESNVYISLETETLGSVNAKLYEDSESIGGYVACNLKETVTKIKDVADKVSTGISVVWTENKDFDLKLSRLPLKDNKPTETAKLYEIAKNFLEALKGI